MGGCSDGSPLSLVEPEPIPTAPVRQGSPKPASVATAAASPLETDDLRGSLNAVDLAQTIAGAGITISNVEFTGADSAAGTFSGGTGIIGFDEGIILSTGIIANVDGTNDFSGVTTAHSTEGDADLDELAGFPTNDAAVLEFDFVPDADRVSFRYVFASDEYTEFVNSQFNDVFAFFVNGENCAVIGDPAEPVSINTINNGNPVGTDASHPELYINNDPFTGGVPTDELLLTEMDGLTVVLTCEAEVNAGETNTMKLAIADGSDLILDANVFIEAQSLATPQPPAVTITSPGDGDEFVVGTAVDFEGSATDPEDGELSGGALVWTSSIDGEIGTGTSLSVSNLSVGTHTITLTATDGDEMTGEASVQITISEEAPPPDNEPPTAEITSPADGASFTEGGEIDFAGSGTDPEDGELTGADLVWTSDLDGQIGTGGSFALSTLSAGTHTITLTATDSEGATGTASVQITIEEETGPPPEELEIEIDVEPGVASNEIDLGGGLLLVGLLGSAEFDPAEVDLASIRLGDGEGPDVDIPNQNQEEFVVELRDLNEDGILDLLIGYCIPDLVASGDLTESSTELVLRAQLEDGTPIRGTDDVVVINIQP